MLGAGKVLSVRDCAGGLWRNGQSTHSCTRISAVPIINGVDIL